MGEIFKINGAEFDCEFQLKDENDEVKIDFSKSAIKGLDLSENLLEPFQNASIMINNPIDIIESSHLARGDGRDKFTISIKNKEASDKEKLEYDFVLSNESNSTSKSDRTSNFKLYSLLDANYFKLNEPIPYGKRYRGAIGDIIKAILKEVVGEDVVDEDNFEAGDHVIDLFPEHILPPTSQRYSDLIKYLLRIYYIEDEGLYVRAFLRFDRTNKKYNLLPISKIFKENKDNTIEAFGASDFVDKPTSNKNNPPPDTKTNKYLSPLFNTNLSTPMLEYSNSYFLNIAASGFDPILGEHGIREVRLEDIKDKWKEKFVDVFSSSGGKPKPFLPLNNKKKEDIFKSFSPPFSLEKSRNLAEAELTSNLTFYNLQLSVNNLGNTSRTAGKFIDIFRQDKEQDVDKKLLGRWLLTKVRHQFIGDSYQNTMQCVKTYVGPGTKISDDVD